MMRGTGTYVVIDGVAHRGMWSPRRQELRLYLGDSNKMGAPLEPGEYERVEDVAVTATWRGGPVTVDRLSDDPARGRVAEIWTEDRALAEREGLDGEQYSGWRSRVPVAELADVQEDVKVREIG